MTLEVAQECPIGKKVLQEGGHPVIQPDFATKELCESGHVSTSHLSHQGAEPMPEDVLCSSESV